MPAPAKLPGFKICPHWMCNWLALFYTLDKTKQPIQITIIRTTKVIKLDENTQVSEHCMPV